MRLYRLLRGVSWRAAVRHPGLFDAAGTCLPGRLLDIAGCETYVVDAPARSPRPLPPVILLHGYGDTADCWRRVCPRCQRHRRVIAIDMPPFGRSGKPPAAFDGQPRSTATRSSSPRCSSELGIESAALVGHSLGGAMALTRRARGARRAWSGWCWSRRPGSATSAPWWWHAISGRWINWPALLRLPNPVAKPAVKAALRGFLEERLVHDTRAMGEVIDHFVHLHGGPRELRHLIDTGRALMAGYTGDSARPAAPSSKRPCWCCGGARTGWPPPSTRRRSPRRCRTRRWRCSSAAGTTRSWSCRGGSRRTIREFLDAQAGPRLVGPGSASSRTVLRTPAAPRRARRPRGTRPR